MFLASTKILLTHLQAMVNCQAVGDLVLLPRLKKNYIKNNINVIHVFYNFYSFIV